MNVEWDDAKAESNQEKHGVSFDEAASVLDDELAVTYADPFHSIEEERFIMVGFSRMSRLLLVVYTERQNSIRLISARPATRAERKDYENEPR